MSFVNRREFMVKDQPFSFAGKKEILDPYNQTQIGLFDSKTLQLRKTFWLRDAYGNILMTIKEKAFALMTTFEFYEGAHTKEAPTRLVGILKRKMAFFRTKFWFEDPSGRKWFNFEGDFIGKYFTITNDRGICAEISKKFWTFRDTYGVRIIPQISDIEAMIILSMAVVLDVVLDRQQN